MSKYIFLIILFFYNQLAAKEYKIEMFFTTNNVSMNLPNNDVYIHVSAPAVWKDSLGDYGNLLCYGRIISNKNKGTELDLFCNGKNQDNNKFWFRMRRDSLEMEAGIGVATYIGGTGKYEKFREIKCKYAAKLFEESSIVNQKCYLND